MLDWIFCVNVLIAQMIEMDGNVALIDKTNLPFHRGESGQDQGED